MSATGPNQRVGGASIRGPTPNRQRIAAFAKSPEVECPKARRAYLTQLKGLVKRKHAKELSEGQAEDLLQLLMSSAYDDVKSTSSIEFKELVEDVIVGSQDGAVDRLLERIPKRPRDHTTSFPRQPMQPAKRRAPPSPIRSTP